MAKKPPFEKIFPYFSYRWRYNDGQYSVYAPFTKAQFVSKDADVSEYFKKGHNTSISNSLQFINFNTDRGSDARACNCSICERGAGGGRGPAFDHVRGNEDAASALCPFFRQG